MKKWLFLIGFGIYFGYLWSHQIMISPIGWVAGSDRTWADGAAHLSLIQSFVQRGFLLGEQPFFSDKPFTYPPAADWLAAVLVVTGFSVPAAFMLVGFGLSMLTLWLLYGFYFEVAGGKKHLPAILAGCLFLWSGGLGWWYTLSSWWQKTPLKGNPVRLTEMTEYGIRFINTIDAEMLPQRAFLLGLPIGLYLLTIGWRWWKNEKILAWQLGSAGCLMGLLPLIHPHTLMVMTVVWGWLLAMSLWQNKRKTVDYLWFLIPVFLIGLPLAFITTQSLGQHFFWIKWGWLAGDFHLNWFNFWWLNWGVWLPLSVLAFVKIPRTWKGFLLPFIGLFILANIVMTQPYDWDNSKILTWVHLAFSGAAGWWLATLIDKKKFSVTLVVCCLMLSAVASGAIDSLRLLDIKAVAIPMFDAEELQLAEWVKSHIPKDATILTSDTHRHWVPVLTGRQIVMGYRGWLWSYGIDYTNREKDVLAMFAGNPGSRELLRNYKIDYVVIGPAEKDAFYRANEIFFEENFARIYQTKTTKIYAVNGR